MSAKELSANKYDPMTGAEIGEETRQLELVLFYEDLETGLRGRAALDRFLNRSEAKASGRIHPWRFDVLGEPACRQEAERDALAADIVAVSMHGPRRLPSSAEASLKKWVRVEHSGPRALVVSLDSNARPVVESNPFLTELRSFVERSGVSMMLHFGEPSSAEMNTVGAGIHRRALSISPVLERSPGRFEPHRDWGINE